jgi:hypothetical protein
MRPGGSRDGARHGPTPTGLNRVGAIFNTVFMRRRPFPNGTLTRRSRKLSPCNRRALAMGDVISLVYTVAIFAALVGFVTFCRKV